MDVSPMAATPVDPIILLERLFAARGSGRYGEDVTQQAHALQCAALAERDGASAALITAALLHDIGHMLTVEAAALAADGDDRHERAGADALARWFGPDITEPVALHVAAKRYLCACEAGYGERLSAASQRSLTLQGGAMFAAEAAAFARLPHAGDAIRLRRWDDAAKERDRMTPFLAHFLAIAERCLTRG